jgi:hypothetical protein
LSRQYKVIFQPSHSLKVNAIGGMVADQQDMSTAHRAKRRARNLCARP